MSPNENSPWPWAPTLSFWLGVQGGYVLQPVVEFNGLIPGDFDLVSWNCCPAGAVVHSDVLDGIRPGDQVTGVVTRLEEDKDVFLISSTRTSDGVSSNLTADMTHVDGDWTATWAEG